MVARNKGGFCYPMNAFEVRLRYYQSRGKTSPNMKSRSSVGRTKHRRAGKTSSRHNAVRIRGRTKIEDRPRDSRPPRSTSHKSRPHSSHIRTCSFSGGCTIERTGQTIQTPATTQCDNCARWFCSTHIDTHGCAEAEAFANSFEEIPLDLGS